MTIDGESSSAVANGAVDVTRNDSTTGKGLVFADISVVSICAEVLFLFGVEIIRSEI